MVLCFVNFSLGFVSEFVISEEGAILCINFIPHHDLPTPDEDLMCDVHGISSNYKRYSAPIGKTSQLLRPQ